MRQTGVGQLVGMVELLRRHWGIRRIDNNIFVSYRLHDAMGMKAVGLLLDETEISGMCPLTAQAFLMRCQHHILCLGCVGRGKVSDLRNVSRLIQPLCNLHHRLFAHAIDKKIGTAINKDGGADTLLPIVVVRQAAHGGLDAAKYNGDIGIEAFEDLGIDYGGIFGALVVPSVGCVGILATETTSCSVLVHHGIHDSGSDAKVKPRTSQFAEVTKVVTPVWLWHNGYLVACIFQNSPYDSRTEGGMIHIRIAAEQNDVQLAHGPASLFQFFNRCGKPPTHCMS